MYPFKHANKSLCVYQVFHAQLERRILSLFLAAHNTGLHELIPSSILTSCTVSIGKIPRTCQGETRAFRGCLDENYFISNSMFGYCKVDSSRCYSSFCTMEYNHIRYNFHPQRAFQLISQTPLL